jgi:hypothetical protein
MLRNRARAAIRIGRCAGLGLALVSRTSVAQLHADVDLEAGVDKRFLTARPRQGENAGFGPTFALSGHIAVLPLLRAGAYASYDLSPLVGADTREITSAGLSFRVLSPWPRGAVRTWFGASFGYARAYAPSYVEPLPSNSQSASSPARVQSTGGGFFETPLGLGASFRFRRSWEILVETGGRIGFGFTGSTYNRGPIAISTGSPPKILPPPGNDSLGVFGVMGIAFEL